MANAQWCRHYTGIPAQVCAQGIPYETVKDTSVRPYRWPCFTPEATTTCASVDRYTQAEEEAFDRECDRLLQAHFDAMRAGRCPTCGATMTKAQVGRCIYAKPCGHRLYQGQLHRIPEADDDMGYGDLNDLPF